MSSRSLFQSDRRTRKLRPQRSLLSAYVHAFHRMATALPLHGFLHPQPFIRIPAQYSGRSFRVSSRLRFTTWTEAEHLLPDLLRLSGQAGDTGHQPFPPLPPPPPGLLQGAHQPIHFWRLAISTGPQHVFTPTPNLGVHARTHQNCVPGLQPEPGTGTPGVQPKVGPLLNLPCLCLCQRIELRMLIILTI